jgi:hypothetical protein
VATEPDAVGNPATTNFTIDIAANTTVDAPKSTNARTRRADTAKRSRAVKPSSSAGVATEVMSPYRPARAAPLLLGRGLVGVATPVGQRARGVVTSGW